MTVAFQPPEMPSEQARYVELSAESGFAMLQGSMKERFLCIYFIAHSLFRLFNLVLAGTFHHMVMVVM